jgi:hypothetical protein
VVFLIASVHLQSTKIPNSFVMLEDIERQGKSISPIQHADSYASLS